MLRKINLPALRYAFKASLPVMAGYLVLGAGFGILLQARGYAFWWAVVMSVTIYAGSMQYVAIDLLSSGAGLLSAALMTVMVNARHILYGISMLEPYRDTGRAKAYLIFALTDETYSLVCSPTIPKAVERKAYFFWVSLLNQAYWVLGSFLGAFFGSLVSINTAGVEFAMTALFVVIFLDQWEKTHRHLPAVTGVSCALICRVLFGAADFLLPTMLLMILVLFLLKKPIERRMENDE